MLIEYYATIREDTQLEVLIKDCAIIEHFNPEEDYYVIETLDDRVVTYLGLLGIEFYILNTDKSWHDYAFGPKDPEE